VLPSDHQDLLIVKPLGGSEDEITGLYLPLGVETDQPVDATFPPPGAADLGDISTARLLYDAARLAFRNGAGPCRALAKLSFRPRAYQMVPLIMALRQDVVRLLIADDVGVGKTVEALLIVRALLERRRIKRCAVVCLPHLCEQWQEEIRAKLDLEAVIIRSNTQARLDRQTAPQSGAGVRRRSRATIYKTRRGARTLQRPHGPPALSGGLSCAPDGSARCLHSAAGVSHGVAAQHSRSPTWHTGGDKFTEKVFRGPLPRMLREALDYIRRNYLNETVIKHPDRAEATRVANFPYEAIEEAVVNAVYHRSYEEREPVEVRITPEELVVLSYPGPDRSVRLDQLRAGRAVPRRYHNRRIGEFLKELDLTGGRATGIPKMFRAMRDNGSPPPAFETDDDYSYFLVRLPVHPEASRVMPPQVTTEVARLLPFCTAPRSRQELQHSLGLRNNEHFRKAYLVPALVSGLLEMTIPDKPNSRLQKYRLTQKGRTWLASHTGNGSTP